MADMLPLLQSQPYWPYPVPRRRLQFWTYRGVSDGRGGRIKLKTVRLVGRLYVTQEAVGEFLALTNWTQPIVQPKPTRSEKAAQNREEEACRKRLREQYGMKI